MTLFAATQSLCGLSNSEAADYLSISESAVEKFRRGNRTAPTGVITELQHLWMRIDTAAVDRAEDMARGGIFNIDSEIEIGYPADDYQAQQLGLPCVGAWRQMLARIIYELVLMRNDFDLARIKLVPRGSAITTAAAIAAREQNSN